MKITYEYYDKPDHTGPTYRIGYGPRERDPDPESNRVILSINYGFGSPWRYKEIHAPKGEEQTQAIINTLRDKVKAEGYIHTSTRTY